MAISQFQIYSSYDSGSPVLTGQTGSAVALLDAVLVDGYGSGSWFKSGSGWSRPFINSSSVGCWRQPSGSYAYLVLNDAGFATGGGKEAHCTGWEQIRNINPANFGTGTGSFPLPNQGTNPTTGSVILRKSSTADATPRPWIVYADAWGFYLFALTGDTAFAYRGLWFGDYSSSIPVSETKKCFIAGDSTQNQSTGGTTNGMYLDTISSVNSVQPGLWLQRNLNDMGASIQGTKFADHNKTATSNPSAIFGTTQTPNASDNSLYIAPIRVCAPGEAVKSQRGRFRGIYQLPTPIAQFFDGQMFSGSNEYVSRVFQLVKIGSNSGMWLVETSNTIETN